MLPNFEKRDILTKESFDNEVNNGPELSIRLAQEKLIAEQDGQISNIITTSINNTNKNSQNLTNTNIQNITTTANNIANITNNINTTNISNILNLQNVQNNQANNVGNTIINQVRPSSVSSNSIVDTNLPSTK